MDSILFAYCHHKKEQSEFEVSIPLWIRFYSEDIKAKDFKIRSQSHYGFDSIVKGIQSSEILVSIPLWIRFYHSESGSASNSD